jgi:hypothetical protein
MMMFRAGAFSRKKMWEKLTPMFHFFSYHRSRSLPLLLAMQWATSREKMRTFRLSSSLVSRMLGKVVVTQQEGVTYDA